MLKWALAMGLAVLLIASAAAETPSTIVDGSLGECQMGILVPENQVITLERGSNNEQHLGIVTVTGCDQNWDFDITADAGSMYQVDDTDDQFDAPFQIKYRIDTGDWSDWINVGDFPAFIGEGSEVVDIWIRQPIGGSEPGGDYRIVLSYVFNSPAPNPPT